MFPLRLAPALQQKREAAASSLARSSLLSKSSSSSSSSSSPLTTEDAEKAATAATTSLSATAVLEAPKPKTKAPSPIPGAVEIPGGGPSSLLPPLQKKKPKTFLPREKQLDRSRDGTDDEDADADAAAAALDGETSSSSSSSSTLAERRKRFGLAPGALDPSNPLGRRARELRGRRAYLKNFWYAVALSEEVKDDGKPVGVTALGRRLALFRDAGDEGRVKAVSDVCPHRSTAPPRLGVRFGRGRGRQILRRLPLPRLGLRRPGRPPRRPRSGAPGRVAAQAAGRGIPYRGEGRVRLAVLR